jgi:hypothetical protein
MAKIAVVIVAGADQKDRVTSGLHVAKRMHDAREDNGIERVEVFLFTGGVRLLADTLPEASALIDELMQAGIVVGACQNQLVNWNLADAAAARHVASEFARDAFSRYAREGYTVLTF